MDFYTNLWSTYQNKNSLNSSTWTIEKNIEDVIIVNWSKILWVILSLSFIRQ
jgi:hypothetical protein